MCCLPKNTSNLPCFFFSKPDTNVRLQPWKNVCSRCNKDRLSRKKKARQAAKFLGYLSTEEDLGPLPDAIRDNGMHFYPAPHYLEDLTMVELASKITVCENIHLLRYGILSSKGHTVSIPQKMKIATLLPQLS